ncbi:MAG TPA: hypothetical protein VIS56_02125 [Candidatus Saccharimonadales bacterium]
MSKLDEISYEVYGGFRPIHPDGSYKNITDKTRQQIKDVFLELIGDVEQRETEDMSLKSWTPEDYKAFGKNELRIELYDKVNKL